MTSRAARPHRGTGLCFVLLAVGTLVGLFAMHTLPMSMDASPTAVLGMSMTAPSHAHQPPAGLDPAASAAMRTAGSSAVRASAVVATRGGGCEAQHDTCVATLPDAPHVRSPSHVMASPAAARAMTAAGASGVATPPSRGPPRPGPCLIDLCISRT